jgi:hypothetical protein
MHIETLRAFEGVPFGSEPSSLAPFGPTLRCGTSTRGEAEFEFEDRIFRFASHGFVEVSFRTPEILVIDGIHVRDAELLSFMRSQDSEYFEYVGFAFSPRLGLMYDLEHDGTWTTAFGKGRCDDMRKKSI